MFSSAQQDETLQKLVALLLSDFDGTLSDFSGSNTVYTSAYQEATNIDSVISLRAEKVKELETILLAKNVPEFIANLTDLIQQVEVLVQYLENDEHRPKLKHDGDILEIQTTISSQKMARLFDSVKQDVAAVHQIVTAVKEQSADAAKLMKALKSAEMLLISAKQAMADMVAMMENKDIYLDESDNVFAKRAATLMYKVSQKHLVLHKLTDDFNKLEVELQAAKSNETYSFLKSTEATLHKDREAILNNIKVIMSRDNKPEGHQVFVLKADAIRFIKQALSDGNTKFVIISKNHRAYIEAILLFNGLSLEELKKIAIYDVNNGGGDKRTCAHKVIYTTDGVEKAETTVFVLDDVIDEVGAMAGPAERFGFRYLVSIHCHMPGKFPFEDITESLLELQNGIDSSARLDVNSCYEGNDHCSSPVALSRSGFYVQLNVVSEDEEAGDQLKLR